MPEEFEGGKASPEEMKSDADRLAEQPKLPEISKSARYINQYTDIVEQQEITGEQYSEYHQDFNEARTAYNQLRNEAAEHFDANMSGEYEISQGDYKVHYSYIPLSQEYPEFVGNDSVSKNARLMKDFTLERKIGERTVSLTLDDIVPNDTEIPIVFYPPSKDRKISRETSQRVPQAFGSMVPMIPGFFSTSFDILALLHEVGHAIDLKTNGQKSYRVIKANLASPLTPRLNENAVELRQERNAWAFALNKLRPFIKKDQENTEEAKDNPLEPMLGTKYELNFKKSSVLSAIHNYCLQGYENRISKEARNDLLIRVVSFFNNLRK